MVRKRSAVRARLEALKILIIWPLGQAVKTPPFHGGNTGSNPVGVTKFFHEMKTTKFFHEMKITFHFGGLAQLGEHLPYKQGVGGSIPSSSTKIFSLRENIYPIIN